MFPGQINGSNEFIYSVGEVGKGEKELQFIDTVQGALCVQFIQSS